MKLSFKDLLQKAVDLGITSVMLVIVFCGAWIEDFAIRTEKKFTYA